MDEGLAEAIVEPVILVPSDPTWPAAFASERERLLAALPGRFVAIEHFGSTAVPGLVAKPVIDLLAGLGALDDAGSLIDPLGTLGYHYPVEFNTALPDRRWLMRQHRGRRTHHLHLVVFDGAAWRKELRFRDVLRASRALAAQYAAHKTELAEAYRDDREGYTRAKAAFVSHLLSAAA
jgi:GrpB-like predicted nucleotidyltransferase (UPF0157 family)